MNTNYTSNYTSNYIQNVLQKCGKCFLLIAGIFIIIYILNKNETFVSPSPPSLPNGIPDGEYPCNANKDLYLLRNQYGPILNNTCDTPNGISDSSLYNYNYDCKTPMFYPAMIENMPKNNGSLLLN